MATKTQQLQIRVSARQKAALKHQANAAGLEVSSYVLAKLLPANDGRAATILRALADDEDRSFALAALNDLLFKCPPIAFADAVSATVFTTVAMNKLTPFLQNYVAAMIEQAAYQKRVVPPSWLRDIAPLRLPYFASSLRSLRQYLIAASPVPFKRRNLFVDAAIGDRV